ncbi:hypothetical protein [Candidatus Portiera aleyrodidarum]|uniref:hypothetical protein n=1 Tax=Candidatus Portiera aleyrodidarum TaxID=91844 RepID=UPI0016008966|nr:hypothetical protein [Candidatus Portiera aleyrodidarum]
MIKKHTFIVGTGTETETEKEKEIRTTKKRYSVLLAFEKQRSEIRKNKMLEKKKAKLFIYWTKDGNNGNTK